MKKDAYYENIQDCFNQLAKDKDGYYDRPNLSILPRHTIWQLIIRRRIMRHLYRVISSKPAGKCLDAGCGRGDFSAQLAKSGFFQSVIGLEYAQDMLDLARQLINPSAPDALEFFGHDLTQSLSFQEKEFHTSICINVMHHLLPEDQELLLNELCRVSSKYIILEIKYPHLLRNILAGGQALGKLPVYGTTPDRVDSVLEKHRFQPVLRSPIFYWQALSPITLLIYSRINDVQNPTFLEHL